LTQLRYWLSFIIAVIFSCTTAETLELEFPLECKLGETCFIEDYVDLDPTKEQIDYRCGIKSRNGHKGVDFGLISQQQMFAGVDVLAAASGKVIALRDGMNDVIFDSQNLETIELKECGNGVLLDHDGGWETMYCHLMMGSILPKVGESVIQGEVLGKVGLSGMTTYPHLHFEVTRHGEVQDPFLPAGSSACTKQASRGLWRAAPEYFPTGIFTVGFSNKVPTFDDVKSGSARLKKMTSATPALVVYGFAFHSEVGDRMDLKILGPNGVVIEETEHLRKEQASLYRAVGKRKPSGGWLEGRYTATVKLKRGNRIIAVRHSELVVSD
tara:strand:+ start:898 stop:1875 length:978 start_codon:yes stop_codon:yes gene_type:complete